MNNKYNILTIIPNNKDDNNDFIDLILADINNNKEDVFNQHLDNLNFELDNCIKDKKIIYYKDFLYEDTLENQINEIYIKNISDKVDITKFNDKIYGSHVIKYTKDFYIILYYNNALLDVLLNKNLSIDKNPNKEFNLLATLLLRELNLKCNPIFGEVFLIKFNHNNDIINISNYELLYLLKDFLYVKYYTEIGIPGLYIDSKDNYKCIFKKDDDITVYEEYNLICSVINDKKIWNKYYLRFVDNMVCNDILKLCDKYNLINIDNIKQIFCYDNVEIKDIEIIKKLGL